jgi:hypothetical protein
VEPEEEDGSTSTKVGGSVGSAGGGAGACEG